jgi:hypothetical protein
LVNLRKNFRVKNIRQYNNEQFDLSFHGIKFNGE